MRRTPALLALLSLAPVVLTGQQPGDVAVRLQAPGAWCLTPRAVEPGTQPLRRPCVQAGARGTITPTAVALSVVRPGGAGKGALIGGAIGLGLGVLGGVVVNAVCAGPGEDPCPEAIPLFGIGGAAVGAGIGALIGRGSGVAESAP